ncbi:MAG: ABC transporter ATP-binding protein [Kiritimatiellae bacterium]|nr:ABC transporter ATP-binding protein [Kiritimatiellia bacterium]
MNLAIEIKGLRKSFGIEGNKIEVIKNLNFSLESGSFEIIMGQSGSGKSTLLHLMAGLLDADEGEIIVGNTEISKLNDEKKTMFRRKNIGLIFQDFNLIPTLTAEENVMLPLLLDRKNDNKKAKELLDLLGLTNRMRHLPSQLSGGERQRIAIARALVTNPAIVLADEPTGNLDSPAAHELCSLLKKLNKETGCSILMVSHDPVVSAVATKVHVLKDGIITTSFATDDDPRVVSERYLAAIEG